MKRTLLLLLLLAGFNLSMSGQSSGSTGTARRIIHSSTLPLACSPTNGDVYFKTTATIGLYICSAPNTWTLLTAGAGAGTVTNTGPLTADLPMFGNGGSDSKVGTKTGTGNQLVTSASPTITSATMITPDLGAAIATSVNKVAITAPAASATLTIANTKTLIVSNSITLAGTDSTTMTFPATSATIARTDAGNTFIGHQVIEGVTSTGATGTGLLVFGTSPTLVAPALGIPTALTLTNATGLPIAGITGLGTGVGTLLATFSSANFAAAVTDESGTGLVILQTSPTIVTPTIASFANAAHNHTNAAGGAQITDAALSAAVSIPKGGTGQATQQAAFNALAPTATRAGDLTYWNGTNYVNLAGNNSGNKVLQEDASGVPTWVSAGAGTVSVVGSSTLTSTACVTGGGSQTLQTPSSGCTVDSSGNLVATSITTTGGSTAGYLQLPQGTAPSLGTTAIQIVAPAAVTSYQFILPGTSATGFLLGTDATNVNTVTFVGFTGTGSVARATSPTFVTPVLGAATATSINSLTITTSTGTVTVTNGKTIAFSNSLTFAGTDGVTYTGPSTSQTLPGMNQTNTGGASFTLDMNASTSAASFRIPNIAGATTTTAGALVLDTTNKNPHMGANGVDNFVALVRAADTIADNDCAKFSVSSSILRVTSAGAQCGAGGGGAAGASLFSTTASTTVTATSATTLIGTVVGSTTIAVNTFTAGQVLHITAQGYYSTPATPASLTIDLKIGGSIRITTGAVAQIASVTNGVWNLSCDLTTRTAGASGTQIANCIFVGTGSTLTPGEAPMQTASTWTIDTTATQAIDLQATWSTATGSPTITATNIAAWIPGAPVTGFTGDGSLISNSGSTGAITVTLATAAAHKFWGNNTGSTAAPGYQSIGTADLPAALANQTSINGLGITASTGALAIANGKTATISNTLTFTGTDSSSVALGAGGTVLYSGGALGTPSSGTGTNLTGIPISTGVSGLGTNVAAFLATPSGANFNSMISAGGVPIPQNSKSAAYTTVLADGGGHIYHPSADTTARTWTIDSNANVAYAIGTTLTFVNDTSAGVLTIAITSDTLILAGAGTTGSRTLAAGGIATAVKITSTRWIINGTGLT